MSTENATENAFPIQSRVGDNFNNTHHGLTKREYFAAMAMQGIIQANQKIEYGDYGKVRDPHEYEIAQNAVRMADALLTELSKTTKQ
jgi:hypothetical protein